jgi:esterase/lipase superfamily enzyme
MRPQTALLRAAALLVLSACTGLGTPHTSGTAMARDASVTRGVPFVTLRNRTGESDPAEYYGDGRGALKAGWCDVDQTNLSVLTPLADAASFYIPDEILRLKAIREVPGEQLLETFAAAKNSRNPLLYTHGAYVSFNRGCKRATLLQENLDLAGRLLFFSWPSDGSLLNYTRDEADMYWSVLKLEDIMQELIRRFGAGRVDLAAHSLGTRGVFLALVGLASTRTSFEPLFNEVVLLAPDIDFDTFVQYLPRIRPLARNFTIYISDNDRPLALSSQLHGYPRLGQTGNDLSRLAGVEVIDLSNIPVRSVSGHVYHLYNPVVAEDMAQLLNEDKRAGKRSNLAQTGTNLWRMQAGP